MMTEHESPPPRRPRRSARARRRLFIELIGALLIFGAGAGLGVMLASSPPEETLREAAELAEALANAELKAAELEQLAKLSLPKASRDRAGKLSPEVKKRHERQAERYAEVLRRLRAQSAAELMLWFVGRWNNMLDAPSQFDRTGRRAELLSLLVGGMGKNLHPGDYVPWQAELLNGNWLGELHYDLDGDGYPRPRRSQNPYDSFADTSICHIAMALNLTASDAHLLVMPELQCDRADAKMSVFLQGKTIDDAITSFAAALRRQGFRVVERKERDTRLVLIGAPTPAGKGP